LSTASVSGSAAMASIGQTKNGNIQRANTHVS
jgi:hypothetical protein